MSHVTYKRVRENHMEREHSWAKESEHTAEKNLYLDLYLFFLYTLFNVIIFISWNSVF